MDSHCECAAETPAAEPPSGKINKAAFKLFKKRKSGGTMPSIFGVKNKGDGKSSGPTGMVRSRTHDGLAEVLVLEGNLVLPGSLTASLECVKEEPPRAARRPDSPGQDASRHAAGCGDIIADPEEEAGPSCDKHVPGPGKPVLSKKNASVVAYQGGGEEMASPDQVDDTYLPEFWDMLSQTEDQGQGTQEGAAKAATASDIKLAPETSSSSSSSFSSFFLNSWIIQKSPFFAFAENKI